MEGWVNDGGTGAVAEYGQGQGLMGEWGNPEGGWLCLPLGSGRM